MQVLKFGGSSVANAANIGKVTAIVAKAVQKESVILVVSALGGVTDQLIAIGAKAAGGDESYKEQIKELEVKHLEAVRGPTSEAPCWIAEPAAWRPAFTFSPNVAPWVCLATVTFIEMRFGMLLLMLMAMVFLQRKTARSCQVPFPRPLSVAPVNRLSRGEKASCVEPTGRLLYFRPPPFPLRSASSVSRTWSR